ncbi:MAG: UDP-N-acetylmuramate dehydrogenase [Deltaproteobacteria bacterium]|nr:UDP-N-acetylmuramate dehydrogenase [Deltaproteobacteria bacterium]
MTDWRHIAPALQAIPGATVAVGEPMARHTSLRVGGGADLFVRVRDEAAACAVPALLAREGCPWLAVGAGTNLLVTDEGLEGAVVALEGDLAEVGVEDGPEVAAGAAASVARLLGAVEAAGASGLEFLTGIPGTVGGAVAMNAGTRYGYVDGAILAARVATADGAEWVGADRLGFGYRRSELPAGAIVCAARFRLCPGRGPNALRIVEDLTLTRKLRHPPAAGTAGSFFRNPDMAAGLFAGRLIEGAGLKGTRRGGALVSPVHANFLTNAGEATAADLLSLAERVRSEVLARAGVALALEVRVVGRGAGEWLARLGG